MKLQDLTGKKFNYLTVLERFPENSKDNHVQWICLCDCGNKRIVQGKHLKNGFVRSCGCKDLAKRHGLYHTRLHYIWSSMKDRCYNKNNSRYSDWGGRGISICDEWKDDFASFYNWAIETGYTDGLSIDRIDNDGDYCPDNCRWITAHEQCRNKRNNIRIEIDGETKILADWLKVYGMKRSTVFNRIKAGMSPVEAVKKRPRKLNRKNEIATRP